MVAVWIFLLVTVLLAAAIVAVVAVGMAGVGRRENSKLSDNLAQTAKFLDGQAATPKIFVDLANWSENLSANRQKSKANKTSTDLEDAGENNQSSDSADGAAEAE